MRWKAFFGIITIALTFVNLPKVLAQTEAEAWHKEEPGITLSFDEEDVTWMVTEEGKVVKVPPVLQSIETQLKSVVRRVDPTVVVVKDANGRVATGVLYRPDGYILTTALVDYNKDTSEFTVQMTDGETHEAQFVGSDVSTGIAVLKIDAENLSTVEFGDSDALEKGSWVMVIGNSYGMSNSISTGVVSGLNRQVNGREMFQITAPINPGMSGAPVINSDGQVVGLVASTFRRAAFSDYGAAGLLRPNLASAFSAYSGATSPRMAYPVFMPGTYMETTYQLQHASAASEVASKLTDLFRKHGESYGLDIVSFDGEFNKLAIGGGKLHHETAKKLIEVLDKPQPVSKTELLAREAQIAAIQAEFEVESALQKQLLDKTKEVETKVKEVERNLKTLRDKLHQQPFALSSEGMNFAIPINDVKYAAEQLIQHGKVNYGWLGVDAKAVPPAVRAQLGLKEGHGVLIKSITSSSPAEKAGLKRWDVVLQFGDTEVDTPKTLQRLVRRTSPGQKISINVVRKGKPLTLTLEIGTTKHR